jgi:CheY-like chemotaxis protein
MVGRSGDFGGWPTITNLGLEAGFTPGKKSQMHVLIVEDEPRTAFAVGDLLTTMGIASFSIAETEQEAVSDALRQPPDLIISDVNLREGMGPRAVHRIRVALGPISAVYMTGRPEIARAYEPDAQILVKPVLRRHLADAVRLLAGDTVGAA